ncbi:MAG: CHAT domain-containing protein [Chloroflexota bacterium]|nr:CHAT domain-containing protein [Chloroflexota bacterium]
MADWPCSHCGAVTSKNTWLAVDAEERPDLIERLLELIYLDCPECRRRMKRCQPILILRMARSAPLIAAQEPDEEEDPLDSLGDVVEAVWSELNDARLEIPGPALLATLEELESAAGRDIDGDLDAARRGAAGSSDHPATYTSLLQKVEAHQMPMRLVTGFQELERATGADQLREIVGRHPEVLSDEAEDFLRELADSDDEDAHPSASMLLQTVGLCRMGDYATAWQRQEATLRAYFERTFIPLWSAYQDARRGTDPVQVAQAGRALLAALRPGSDLKLELEAAAVTATALDRDESASAAESVEDAITLNRRALSIMDAHSELDDPPHRVALLMNLGRGYRNRSKGDPDANLSKGIDYMTEALDLLDEFEDRDVLAMAQTNLGLFLIERASARDFDAARILFEQALRHRSFARSPRDWAFTQLNLAIAYSHAESGNRVSNVRQAIHHSAEARTAAVAAEDTLMHVQAEHNLAVQRLELARLLDGEPKAQERLFDRAEASGLEVVRLCSSADLPHQLGSAWLVVSKVRLARDDADGAVEALTASLSVLSNVSYPEVARQAGLLLRALAEELGDFELAADAAAHFVEAAAAVIARRARSRDRMSELYEEANTEFHCAVSALVRVERLAEAALSAERRRAGELELLTLPELLDLDTVSQLDPNLGAQILDLGTLQRSDILGLQRVSQLDLSDRQESVRAAIRDLPTYARTVDAPDLVELGQAVESQRPLVYLGAAANGAYAIIVGRDANGDVELDSIHAPECDTGAIIQRLVDTDPRLADVETAALVVARSLAQERLNSSMSALSHVLGEQLLCQLSECLAGRGAVGVTLVATGCLGLLPLHAIDWPTGHGGRRCLLDDFEVTYAPSARIHAACALRAEQRHGEAVRLVGIANPLPNPIPLRGAEIEAELVRSFAPPGRSHMLFREEATKQSLLDALPSGTHIHLACHAGSRLDAPLYSASVSLAGPEQLSFVEIANLDVSARLVFASACETGVPQGSDEIDESLSLASAFLAAGAAGVISSLWKIHDDSSAFFAYKFYEGTFKLNMQPAAGPRRAQLWLRDATQTEIDTVASDQPALRALRDLRGAPSSTSPVPYSEPFHWAAFAFSGA